MYTQKCITVPRILHPTKAFSRSHVTRSSSRLIPFASFCEASDCDISPDMAKYDLKKVNESKYFQPELVLMKWFPQKEEGPIHTHRHSIRTLLCLQQQFHFRPGSIHLL